MVLDSTPFTYILGLVSPVADSVPDVELMFAPLVRFM